MCYLIFTHRKLTEKIRFTGGYLFIAIIFCSMFAIFLNESRDKVGERIFEKQLPNYFLCYLWNFLNTSPLMVEVYLKV